MKGILAILLASIISGCVSNHGQWGNYPNELYTYYKDSSEQERTELTGELTKIFARAEAKGTNPPPGLYAEYGTLMLTQGETEQAIIYYTKERESWPESAVLMNSLINTLTSQQSKNGEAKVVQ